MLALQLADFPLILQCSTGAIWYPWSSYRPITVQTRLWVAITGCARNSDGAAPPAEGVRNLGTMVPHNLTPIGVIPLDRGRSQEGRIISSLQRRVALLEQADADDNPQAEMAAAWEYYADPLGFVKWGYPWGKGRRLISRPG